MLVSMKELLERASKENYGVVAPNLMCEIDARAYIAAAEEMNSPLILDISVAQTKDISLIGKYIAKIADESRLPIAVNLDHGGSKAKSFEEVSSEIMKAFNCGFTSVMVDRSYLSFEENIKETAILTKLAHSLGISVEAELGHVDSGEDYVEKAESMFTNPKQAKEFLDRTGVDCMAVAVGTAHGLYKGIPHIEFELIKEIKKEVNGLPLVVHGGSGAGYENLQKACQVGINKVNIGFDLVTAAVNKIKEHKFEGIDAYNIYAHVQSAEIEKMKELIECFGSKGKAWVPERKFVDAKDRLLDLFEGKA